MKTSALFSILFGVGVLSFGLMRAIDPPAPPKLQDLIVHVSPDENIQQAVEDLASEDRRGGTVLLDAGATYRDAVVRLPWTHNLSYSNIRIHGDRTRLVSRKDATGPVVWIGDGWTDGDQPKLEGVELSGLIVEQTSEATPNCKAVRIEFTRGAVIRECEFVDCPFEAVYEGGGKSNEQLAVTGCHAFRCGLKWASGPLAAFNLNGFGSRLVNSSAHYCGWGVESGGTEVRIVDCQFVDSPCTVGSSVYGCSNVIFSGCTFERSPLGFGNGRGKIADVRILRNTFLDSPVGCGGMAAQNTVDYPGLPFHDHVSLIADNTFVGRSLSWQGAGIGQAIRIATWANAPDQPNPPMRIEGNRFDCPDGQAVIVQGEVRNPITFRDNSFSAGSVGTVYLSAPGGKPLKEPGAMLGFGSNRAPSKAWIQQGSKKVLVN